MTEIPDDHPRAESLRIRKKIEEGFKDNVVAVAGLFAHGRGEAFDYIIGEETQPPAIDAIKAALAMIKLAKNPVFSINGNIAALAPDDIVKFARKSNIKLEINLFYRSEKRIEAIKQYLLDAGAREILGTGPNWATIPELSSQRRLVDPEGILKADVVLVPLEDGDRTEALRKIGKIVITIDLNPLSRTAQWANITIVDNFIRAIKLFNKHWAEIERLNENQLKKIVNSFDNKLNLSKMIKYSIDYLSKVSEKGIFIENVIEYGYKIKI
ncbi:MAG: phosphopantothenate/pantothenate synthetase [Candidatus Helarchaeota archaeon]